MGVIERTSHQPEPEFSGTDKNVSVSGRITLDVSELGAMVHGTRGDDTTQLAWVADGSQIATARGVIVV